MPPLTHLTAQMNLSVLKRYSPQITSVVTTASYAVVYIFNTATVTWDRLNIEGTLFIVALNGACPPSSLMEKRKRGRRPPKQREQTGPEEYQLIILNRRNLDNFIIPLTSPEDVESTDKFVILRSRTRCGAIDPHIQQGEEIAGDEEPIAYGLWVWGEIDTVAGDKERIEKIVRELSERVLKGKSLTAGVKAGTGASPTQVTPQAPQNYEDNCDSNSDDPGNGGGGVAMNARSISLTDLFNQRRKEDEESSRSHQRPAPFPQNPPYPHHYQAPVPPLFSQNHQHHQHHQHQHHQPYPPQSYESYYQQNSTHQPPSARSQQLPHFAHHLSTSKFSQLPHQRHTPSSSQSMPPPPNFLPTPAPQGGASIYPTPPLPPSQSSRPTSQSQLPPVVNYRTPSSSSSTLPGYTGIGSSSGGGGDGGYTIPPRPDYPGHGSSDIIARLFHNAAQNSGGGSNQVAW